MVITRRLKHHQQDFLLYIDESQVTFISYETIGASGIYDSDMKYVKCEGFFLNEVGFGIVAEPTWVRKGNLKDYLAFKKEIGENESIDEHDLQILLMGLLM